MACAKTWNAGLPVELLDIIVEDMELEAQKACSLVCRDWLDVTRRHIFDTIVVRSDVSFDPFLRFLTTHPHVSGHIHKMYLLGPRDNSPSYKADKFPLVDPVTLVEIAMSALNVFRINLETVQLVDVPQDAKARLESLPGPIQLSEFSLTKCPLAVDHSPVAILRLFYLFETERMQIELSSGWAPFPLEGADNEPPVVALPWQVQHDGICLKKIAKLRETHLDALTHILVPGSLQQLHLDFYHWSHFEEMGRFLQHFGESITEFTITFGHALSNYKFRDHAPSEEEWASYGFSHLRNLSKLRFDLQEPLTCNFDDEPVTWMDGTGIPRFLACFPRDLPLQDGVDIDVRYVGDIVLGGYGIVKPRPEIEDALLRFENLKLVGLCPESSYGCEYAWDFGAEAFPRLWEARALACMDEVDECCP